MASTVVEPDVPEEAKGGNGANGTSALKRRLPDTSEQERKRQRTSPGKSSPAPVAAGAEEEENQDVEPTTAQPAQNDATHPREARRKSGVTDEKQRSKRLFGALLGNLNRPSDRVSKRRLEIEQRRKAELQKQDDERLEDRQRRLERLAARRKREQITVDEEIMRTRHENMLNAANFLQTKSEPRIYYRPWDLLPDEEDRIDDQIQDTKEQIDKEVADFEAEKRRRIQELREHEDTEPVEAPNEGDDTTETIVPAAQYPETEKPHGDAAEQETSKASTNVSGERGSGVPEPDAVMDVANDNAAVKDKAPAKDMNGEKIDVQKEDVEEEGDHVVVGDEDTVEY